MMRAMAICRNPLRGPTTLKVGADSCRKPHRMRFISSSLIGYLGYLASIREERVFLAEELRPVVSGQLHFL
jgi:hypothetical protein